MVETQWVVSTILHLQAHIGHKPPRGLSTHTPLTDVGAVGAMIFGAVIFRTNPRWMDEWNPLVRFDRLVHPLFLAPPCSKHPCLLVILNERNRCICNSDPFRWILICFIHWKTWSQVIHWIERAFHGHRWWRSSLYHSVDAYSTTVHAHKHAFPPFLTTNSALFCLLRDESSFAFSRGPICFLYHPSSALRLRMQSRRVNSRLRSFSFRCIRLCIVSSKGPIRELNFHLLVLHSSMDALEVSAFARIRMCV